MDLESSSEGTAALYELAIRLIPREYPPGTPYEEPPRIWAGGIPEDLPVALPLPENARVIGTYGAPQLLTILVDTDMRPKDVLAFYRERLERMAWKMRPVLGQGGFLPPTELMRTFGVFCASPHEPAITVTAEDVSAPLTQVTITVVALEDNPCFSSEGPSGPPPRREHVVRLQLPALEVPPGSEMVRWGSQWGHSAGGSGREGVSATTEVAGRLDLAGIVAWYETQLEQAGWSRQDSRIEGSTARSIWTLAAENGPAHEGFFFAVQHPKTQVYHLYVELREGPTTREGS
jgi:hypothetical protein